MVAHVTAIGLAKRLALASASAGLAISTSLTLAHLSNKPLPCGGGSGCEDVAHDPSSQWLGIPVAAFGMLAYLILFVCALLSFRGSRKGVCAGLGVSVIGVLISAWLTYHSLTVIHATCIWCLSSAAAMVVAAVCFALLAARPDSGTVPVNVAGSLPWVAVPILGVAAIAFFGKKTIEYNIDLSKVDYQTVASTSHPFGNPNARITIAEFGDLMCPACRQMHPALRKFQSRYPDKVNLLFHHFPMIGEPGHELSEYAAELSDRIDKTGFWKFVDTVYASDNKPDKQALDAIFASCPGPRASEKDAKTSVQKAIDLGKQIGVKLTPTYIIFIDKKPDAFATSTNIHDVLLKPEFRAIIAPTAK